MIPKASQRGLGQDLATHLLNALDNEYVEVAEVSGAVATDLHGAFAEWEAIAKGLTKCREYLYSLSVNPGPDSELSRAQYLDYAQRVEKKLGLEGQPRALVFHIKDGREHCHMVWSRIDWQSEKAIHLAFDHEKLMMVSREFARDHKLTLPDGYRRDASERGRRQSLYETQQERMTGLSKQERMDMITQAYRHSDSARSFVQALEAMGYVLATGKRPYVLVDMYGTMNALPKMIDDRNVRTLDVRKFLWHDFPPTSLPSVEEARALVAELRKAREEFAKAGASADRLTKLEAMQGRRRAELVTAQERERTQHRHERTVLAGAQLAERQAHKSAYLAQVRAVRAAREEARPTGLAAFLGKVTGVSLVIGKLHRHRDAKAYRAFVAERQDLIAGQKQAASMLQRQQEVHGLDGARQLRALVKVELRERQALEVKRVREQRTVERQGRAQMPGLDLDLRPRGRGPSVRKAKNRYQDPLRTPEERLPQHQTAPKKRLSDAELLSQLEESLPPPIESDIDLRASFERAAEDTRGEGERGEEGGEGGGPSGRARRSDRDDFERER
ncbi:relaxase/mobilization nuclease domain-containing protein [Rhizobium sp. T1470]|uniref:relaxase/mobilization nuclease domain-containing protein n=1 Tax=unclassified Rhizobium TaxID=2613769 RepID=UPI001AAF7CD4|nr:relaxase/mobilization nuclease domain-containing protein [Rhizobium sp. T1473]MCA0800440.1 relaxase/mobilization nuclease domain-containing protein [Rhizobium sp. T1473]